MNKTILFDSEAREKVRKGVNIIADAVAVTLGATGRNVLISENVVVDYSTRGLPIKVTKDGVTVARSVHLTDLVENIGATMMREASEKTMLQAGDGTTTTIVLARAFVEEGMKMIEAGSNPMELKSAIDKAVMYVVDEVKKRAVPVDNDIEKIRQIAIVSANNDESIGNLVAEAFQKIGSDGIINIEEAKSVNTTVKIVDGFELKTGYISPFFITDRSKNMCELTEPNVLLYEKSINNLKDVENVLRESIETRRPLLIICEDCNGDALATLIMNHVEKRIPPVCIVRVPYFTDNKLEVMEDIAVCTGATYITDSKGFGIDRATIEHLGKAAKVTVSKDSTVIIGGYKNKEDHERLLIDLQMNKASAQSEEDKAVAERRIARLNGGIAVIYVGGPTETEMKERVDRVDDAVRAVKAANEEGYVAGGGTVFLGVTNSVTSGQFDDGWKVMMPVLMAPIKQMIKNAGISSGASILQQIDLSPEGVGFNAKSGVVEDLMGAGIVDPVKVLRCSLQNAASVAGMILTSQCIICDTLN
jgi:chaperonin GroEL